MAGGRTVAARRRGRDLGDIGIAALPLLLRGARTEHGKEVRILLAPRKGLFLAVDTDAEAILLAGGDLRGDEDALCALLEVDEHVAVVIQRPTHEVREFGEDFPDLQPRDVLGEVCRSSL